MSIQRRGRAGGRKLKRQWPFATLAVGLALAAAGAGLMGGMFTGDSLVHLKTGAWVLAHGKVPHSDIFSWTAKGQPWIAQEWLWGVVAWESWKLLGWRGVEALVVASAVATLLGLRRLAGETGADPRAAWIVPAIGVMLAVVSWQARAQTAGFALLAWTAALSFAPEWKRATWPVLLGMGALWANVHGGSAALGPGLLVASGLAGLLERRGTFRRNIAGALVMALGEMANPYGPGLWAFFWKLALSPEWAYVRQSISEWRPPDTSNPFILAILAVCLGWTFLSVRRARRDVLVLTLVFWVAALAAARNVAVLALWLGGTAHEFWRGEEARWRVRSARLVAIAGLVAVMYGLAFLGESRAFDGHREDGVMLRAAEETAAWEKANGMLCANDDAMGDYLIWIGTAPAMDGRADLYVNNGLDRKQSLWMAGLGDPPAECAAIGRPSEKEYAAAMERLRLEGWREVRLEDVTVFVHGAGSG